MIGFSFQATFQNTAWTYLDGISAFQLVQDGGGYQLYVGSGAWGGIIGFDLASGVAASHIGSWAVNGRGSDFRLNDLALLDQGDGTFGLIATESGSNHIESYDITQNGSLIGANALSIGGAASTAEIVGFTVGGNQFIATGGGGGGAEGLYLYEITDGSTAVLRDTWMDHVKVTVGDIADLVWVEVGAASFLVVGSALDGGISTFSVDGNGDAHLIDAIGIKEGMWIAGLDSLTAVQAGSTSYIVVGATNSSSLSVVRINPMGVLFVTDHITDTLGTRFANVDATDSFSVNGRGFIVAGGGDDGLSLFEILPDGQLFAHDSIANQAGWSLENITSIQAALFAEEVQVFAAGSGTAGIMQFSISTGNIAPPVTGGSGNDTLDGWSTDDLIYGGAGNDMLRGHTGDDILFGGAGADILIGGAGADVFVFDAGPDQDHLWDFELGQDRIDLSRWGMIYSPSALTITSHADSATISFAGHSLRVWTNDLVPMTAADLIADHFIF